jgi:hypothetical protein
MNANLKNVGKWSRWIGGTALALTLAGPLASTPTSAEINEGDTVGHEVIPVEGTAPEAPPQAPWGPGGYTGGGSSGSPSGPSGGGGGGSQGSTELSTRESRIAEEKLTCTAMYGKWGRAVFNDIDTNIRYSGYSCRQSLAKGQYTWFYFDSEGYYNHRCVGDLEVQECE